MKDPGTALFICAVFARNARRWQEKTGYPQISPMTQILEFQICEIDVICGSPWHCARRRKWRQVKGVCLMRFDSTQHKAIEAEASGCATLRANGTGCRAKALLRRCAHHSKMRTIFEKCASWKSPEISSKMRTVFQGAHEKLRIFERSTVRIRTCVPKHCGTLERFLS
jgi:hypothetical protein